MPSTVPEAQRDLQRPLLTSNSNDSNAKQGSALANSSGSSALPAGVSVEEYEKIKGLATEGPTLIFDGVCSLCNGAMRWYWNRLSKELQRPTNNSEENVTSQVDTLPKKQIHFMWCQHPVSLKLLHDEFGISQEDAMVSWVYLENGKVFRASSAWLKACSHLEGGGWRFMAGILTYVPEYVRDPFYYLVARNRYRIFGKSETCQRPPKGLKEKLLHGYRDGMA